jgi:hypothetical protein
LHTAINNRSGRRRRRKTRRITFQRPVVYANINSSFQMKYIAPFRMKFIECVMKQKKENQ